MKTKEKKREKGKRGNRDPFWALKRQKFAGWEGRFTPAQVAIPFNIEAAPQPLKFRKLGRWTLSPLKIRGHSSLSLQFKDECPHYLYRWFDHHSILGDYAS